MICRQPALLRRAVRRPCALRASPPRAARGRPRRLSPLISVGCSTGRRRAVAAAAFFAGLAVISLIAFLFSRETKDVDIGEPDPAQQEIVGTPEPMLTR